MNKYSNAHLTFVLRRTQNSVCNQYIISSLLLILILTTINLSQERSGTLSGKITDEQGNNIADAKIYLTNSSGKVTQTSSGAAGSYTFYSLTPGRYKISVDSKSFDAFVFDNVLVTSGKAISFDVQLRIKPIIESVEIGEDLKSNNKLSNFGRIKLDEKQVEDQLPDNPDALLDALKAMAPSGPGDPQIFVDGFESATPPLKQTIREVYISSNTFTAEDDRPSGARIQIFTKSGLNKFQGGGLFNWSNNKINARNPFAKERPPYSYKQYGFNLSGIIVPKRSSFFVNLQMLDEDQSGIVTAQILSNLLRIESLNSPFVIPRRDFSVSGRVDSQLNENNSLTIRYNFSRLKIDNLGVGELTLAERGYKLNRSEHLLQVSNASSLNSQTANEFRFQFISTNNITEDKNSNVSLNVQDAFLGGSAGLGQSSNNENRFEAQNYITTNFAKHLLRFGVRLRLLQIDNVALNNFNGTFTFTGGEAPQIGNNNQIILGTSGKPILEQITSIERYRRTLLLKNFGFNNEEIRLRGGGASQFSIARGNPEAKVSQFDFGAFLQEEWRVKPNLNIYLGVRYEGQTNIKDLSNVSPRLAFAWVPKLGKNQNTTIRSGIGLYYNRFESSYILQSIRFNGIQQQRFISSDPVLIDSFPSLPTSDLLSKYINQQSVTRIADNVQAPRSLVSLISLEHKISSNNTIAIGLSNYRTRHNLRQRNINAPLPGTYIYGQNGSGVRPYGNTGNIFLFESSNDFFQNQFYANYRNQISSNFTFYINYLLSDTKDGGSIGSFPADSYNLRSEWGRASSSSIRHRLYLTGRMLLPKINVNLSPQIVIFSQRPFNITTGIDTNGDQIFLERPAYSSTNSSNTVYNTQFGNFDINPTSNQQIIPRNIGKGPSFFSFNTVVSRTFNVGKGKTTANKSAEKPYKLTFSLQVSNLFNNVNLSTPIGNLSSPLFGKSTSTVGSYGYENGSSAYNRRIEAQVRFSF